MTRSFHRRSSQPISWPGTEETKPNTTEGGNAGISWPKQIQKTHKNAKRKPTCKFKNRSCVCVYHGAQLSYTIQHRTVRIISPPDNHHSSDCLFTVYWRVGFNRPRIKSRHRIVLLGSWCRKKWKWNLEILNELLQCKFAINFKTIP